MIANAVLGFIYIFITAHMLMVIIKDVKKNKEN